MFCVSCFCAKWIIHPGTLLLTCSADAHSLLVSASGYWKAFQDLLRLMPFPDLLTLVEDLQETIKSTVAAGNHIEHITERIVNGRKGGRRISEIPAELFQQAVGRIEFPAIIFGDESFDLAELSI